MPDVDRLQAEHLDKSYGCRRLWCSLASLDSADVSPTDSDKASEIRLSPSALDAPPLYLCPIDDRLRQQVRHLSSFAGKPDCRVGVQDAGEPLNVEASSPREVVNASAAAILVDADLGHAAMVCQKAQAAFQKLPVANERRPVATWPSGLPTERAVAVKISPTVVNQQPIFKKVGPFESKGFSRVYAVFQESGFYFDGANSETDARMAATECLRRHSVKRLFATDMLLEELKVCRILLRETDGQNRLVFEHASIGGDEPQPIRFLLGVYGIKELGIARVCRRVANRLADDASTSKDVIDGVGHNSESPCKGRTVYPLLVQAANLFSLVRRQFRLSHTLRDLASRRAPWTLARRERGIFDSSNCTVFTGGSR